MNPKKIVLFIFVVLAGLAGICLVFPKDGIKFGSVKLEFPTLAEVMEVDTTKNMPSPEEVLAQREEAQKKAKSGEFEEFMKKDPARFYFPKDDVTFFDSLFAALENADKKHVRIMHYGDSQLECDYMSSTLRTYMQELFGGGGVGMLSPNYYDYKETTSRSQSPEPESYLVFDQRNHKLSNGKYGITGHSIKIDGNQNYTITSTSKDKFPTSYTFSKVSLVASDEVSVTANGNKMKLEAEREGMKLYTTRVEPTHHCNIHVNGNAYLYGLMLDTPTGVSVDNISLRGCSGTIFTGIEKSSFAPFYQMENVGLIILQFGGNTAESLDTEEQCKRYAETIREQLKMFKRIAPKSKILFIPPADMGTSIKGKKQTYPILPTFNNTLKKMCLEEGVAFWNMFEAMGGMNTIVQWVNADPPLAIRDYTHFTPLGAQTVTKILCETFQIYYNSYRLRKGEKLVDMPKEQVVEKATDKKKDKKSDKKKADKKNKKSKKKK